MDEIRVVESDAVGTWALVVPPKVVDVVLPGDLPRWAFEPAPDGTIRVTLRWRPVIVRG